MLMEIPRTMTAGLTTVLPLLSYQYEGSAIGSSPATKAIKDFKKLEARLKAGANIRFDVKQRIRLADKAAISIARPMTKETRLSTAGLLEYHQCRRVEGKEHS